MAPADDDDLLRALEGCEGTSLGVLGRNVMGFCTPRGRAAPAYRRLARRFRVGGGHVHQPIQMGNTIDYYPVHMLGTMRLNNASFPLEKNARTLPGFFCSSRNLELTARCKSLRARINARATPWFMTSFQTSSSGLISGEYGGRGKNSRRQSFTWCTKRAPTLALCAGNPSTARKIFFE